MARQNKRMPFHHAARLRLLALCVAVACRVAVYAVVTVLAVRQLQGGNYSDYRPVALAAWLALCAAPALLLSPLIGVLAASRWCRVIQIGGTAIVVALLAWSSGADDVPWLSVAGVLSLEAAFFAATVLASIPAIAAAAHLNELTTRVLVLLPAVIGAWFMTTWAGATSMLGPGPALVMAAIALTATVFASASTAGPATKGLLRPFLEGSRETLRHRRARSAFIGLLIWFFVALATTVGLVRIESAVEPQLSGTGDVPSIFVPLSPVASKTNRLLAGVAVGLLFTLANRYSFRHGGFVPYAAILALISTLGWRFGDSWSWPLLGIGLSLGMSLSPLLHFQATWIAPKFHGVAAGLLIAGGSAGAIVLAVILFNLGDDPLAARTPILNILIGVTGIAVIGAPIAFGRAALEMTIETLLWPVYRIHSAGPGAAHLPARGPCLVIANHAAWFDPLFLAKILPAPTTPMMTSKFYDLPVLSWLMRHVIGTIRVPEVPYRHEAPELQEAIAALDRGECIVLFPEGYLRRKEELPLRRFGRGIWKILSERPATPVFACWIDGNWGSYFSHRGGPPARGKRIDFWTHIRIGVLGPIRIDPSVLADHMATRTFLMQQVAAAREPLGLPPLDVPAAGEGDKE
jgi:1-acyl-sn-glycerol-3-phosphate acyltransferase